MKKRISLLIGLFIINFYLFSQQVENGGFEAWEDAGTVINEPVDWSSIKTSDNSTLNGVAPAIWGQSTDSYTGDFSVKLFNVSPFSGLIVTGTLTNGRVHSDFNPDLGYVYTDAQDARWNTPFTIRADSLIGWYKFSPEGNDFGRVQALLHVGYAKIPEKEDSANWVGKADFYMQPGQAVNTWTRFAVPFVYFDDRMPEYILFVLNSGNGTTPVEGSWALFDDLFIVDEQQSIGDYSEKETAFYITDKILYLRNLPVNFLKNSQIEILDITGRLLIRRNVNTTKISLQSVTLVKGIYIVRLFTEHGVISNKVYIN